MYWYFVCLFVLYQEWLNVSYAVIFLLAKNTLYWMLLALDLLLRYIDVSVLTIRSTCSFQE